MHASQGILPTSAALTTARYFVQSVLHHDLCLPAHLANSVPLLVSRSQRQTHTHLTCLDQSGRPRHPIFRGAASPPPPSHPPAAATTDDRLTVPRYVTRTARPSLRPRPSIHPSTHLTLQLLDQRVYSGTCNTHTSPSAAAAASQPARWLALLATGRERKNPPLPTMTRVLDHWPSCPSGPLPLNPLLPSPFRRSRSSPVTVCRCGC